LIPSIATVLYFGIANVNLHVYHMLQPTATHEHTMSKIPSIIRDLKNAHTYADSASERARNAIMNGIGDAGLARRLATIVRDLDAEIAALEIRFEREART
jgi:hypothetical protein